MTILLAIGLLAGLVFAVSWAAEPLLRPAPEDEDRADDSESPPKPDPLAEATSRIDVLEQDLLEGVIAPEEFADQRAGIRYGAAGALAALERRDDRLAATIEQRVARLVGSDTPAAETAESAPAADEGRSDGGRGWRWIAGTASAVMVFTGILVGLVLVANSTDRQNPVAELALTDYRALASGGASSEDLVLLHAGGLMRSADGGRTWREGRLQVDINAVAAIGEDFLVAGDGMVRLSPDGVVAIDIGGFGMLTPLRALAADAGRAVAVDAGGGIFVSRDGGETWERLPLSAPATTTAVAIMADRGVFFVATRDQGLLVGDGVEGWGGANGFVSGALPTVRIRDVGFDPDSGDTFESPTGERFRGALYVATDLGLFKSVDAGGSWRALALTGDIAALDVSGGEPAAVTVVDSRGRVYRSLDGGVTWPASE